MEDPYSRVCLNRRRGGGGLRLSRSTDHAFSAVELALDPPLPDTLPPQNQNKQAPTATQPARRRVTGPDSRGETTLCLCQTSPNPAKHGSPQRAKR